jgi:hypothetical protein
MIGAAIAERSVNTASKDIPWEYKYFANMPLLANPTAPPAASNAPTQALPGAAETCAEGLVTAPN